MPGLSWGGGLVLCVVLTGCASVFLHLKANFIPVCLNRLVYMFVSVCDRMWCYSKTLKVPLCSLGNTRPGQKVTGLSSECAVCRHSAAQGRTVNQHFHLGSMRRLRNADRRNGQEMAVSFCGKSQSHPSIALTCAVDVGRTPRSTVE